MSFVPIVGHHGYIISYIEEPDRYYNYLDAMKEMRTSLRIQNTSGTNEGDKPGLNTANIPNAISVNPMTHTMYVTNGGSNTVSVINTKTNRISNIPLEGTPKDLSIDTDYNLLYVCNMGSNTVSVINTLTNGVISNIPVQGRTPVSISGDIDDNVIFTANRNSGTVSVIDTGTNAFLRAIRVGSSPEGVAVNPITHTLYVTNSDNGTYFNNRLLHC